MIGLITINDYKNMGNRLQNYAMFKILSTYGATYNIVRFLNCEKKTADEIKKENRIIWFRNVCKFFIPGKHHYSALRYFSFMKFNKMIQNGDTLSADTDYDTIIQKYDYFVTGSDQVWNPSFEGNGMYINMLAFAPTQKRVAGCPSISIDKFSSEQEIEFSTYLTSFSALSCREKQGSEYITKLTGKQCTTLIDPTLAISKEEWDRVAKKPKTTLPCNYIFLYFLGGITEEYNKIIQEIAKKESLSIVNVNDRNSKYYRAGPAEFIYMLKNSSLVITDSYHGTVFSLIYNKPIKVFGRIDTANKMNSRFDSLIELLGIDRSMFEKNNKDFSAVSKISYSTEMLALRQVEFFRYLNTAIKKNSNEFEIIGSEK